MSSRTFLDSRRLPGPNLLMPSHGAVLDVHASNCDDGTIERWARFARELLDAVGWGSETTCVRRYDDGASLAITAPIDALYAATEVNEWAWDAAVQAGDAESLTEAAVRLRATIGAERNLRLVSMQAAAARHDVAFLSDDDEVSVGMGVGSATWAARAIPDPPTIDWSTLHDIPVALITGSNGKTTTVRLLAAIARAGGRTAGYTSTDGTFVGDALVDRGDWSGPGGARAVLRDRRVELALLETARGGILRRGLAVDRADVAIVTNAAADHLGEWGVQDVGAVAEAKLVVRRGLKAGRSLVLNADDDTLVERASNIEVPVIWTSLDDRHDLVRSAVADGRLAYTVRDGVLGRVTAGGFVEVVPIDRVPITVRGAAQYNVYNVLGAIAVATELGFNDTVIATGLMEFSGSATDNPGRGNFHEFGGARVLVDFAHNPHGMDALVDLLMRIPARRRLVLIGQAGDRDDQSIQALARSMWRMNPDVVVIKEMRKYLRGRAAGVIPAIIEQELLAAGAKEEQLHRADTEWQGVRLLLDLLRDGDLLFLPIHADRDLVLDLMARLEEAGWVPGQPVPSGN